MPRTIKNYPVKVSIRVDRETYEKLKELKEKRGISMSMFMREVIKYALKRIEEYEKTKI